MSARSTPSLEVTLSVCCKTCWKRSWRSCARSGDPRVQGGVRTGAEAEGERQEDLGRVWGHEGHDGCFSPVRLPSIRLRFPLSYDGRLRTINGEDEVGPDGVSIKARLEHLVEQTASDIKRCANACDAYLKKKLVVKIVTGHKWESVLAKFAGHFHKRRSDFEFALSIHTGLGVDKANAKLDELGDVAKQIEERCVVQSWRSDAMPDGS